ncbi:MAG: hypothetical protein AABW73_00250 [Nanoarchaeota archaeon]
MVSSISGDVLVVDGLNSVFSSVQKEVDSGLVLLTADVSLSWVFHKTRINRTVDGVSEPPVIQVCPKEERIIVYDELFSDLAVNIKECFFSNGYNYAISRQSF